MRDADARSHRSGWTTSWHSLRDHRGPLGHRGEAAGLGLLLGVGGLAALGPPAFVVVGMLLAAIVVAWWAPGAAVAAALAATPWGFHPVAVAGRSFSLLELAILAGVLGTAPRMLASSASEAGRARLRGLVRPWAVTLPAAGLLVVASLSLVTLADPGHRAESLREYRTVMLEPLAFFGLCRWSMGGAAGRDRGGGVALAGLALLGSGVLVAAIAIGEVATGGGIAADAVRRATGPYPHPNNLALYLERVAVFGLGAAAMARSTAGLRIGRRAIAVLTLVCLLGLVLSFSRGGVLGAACGAAVVAWSVRSPRLRLAVGAGVVATVGVFAAAAGPRLVAAGGLGEGLADSTRWPIWRASLAMARDHPILGVGLDQFLYQYWPRYVEARAWPERYTSHPHNLVLDLWLRLGILGLVCAVWLGGAVARIARRGGGAAPGGADGWRLGAGGALVAGLAHGLVDQGFFLPDLAVLTWYFVALVEVPVRSWPMGGGAEALAAAPEAGHRPVSRPRGMGAAS